jgi:hypothetical protein
MDAKTEPLDDEALVNLVPSPALSLSPPRSRGGPTRVATVCRHCSLSSSPLILCKSLAKLDSGFYFYYQKENQK